MASTSLRTGEADEAAFGIIPDIDVHIEAVSHKESRAKVGHEYRKYMKPRLDPMHPKNIANPDSRLLGQTDLTKEELADGL